MQATVALQSRGQVAQLRTQLWQLARQFPGWQEPDQRNTRTWWQFILGIVVKRSTRLLTIGQAVLGQRQAQSVKAVAMSLAYFLRQARFPMATVSAALLATTLQQVAPQRLATYGGKVLVAIDPTEYQKRSRGRGKRGRQMQSIGRVRQSSAKRETGTTWGYVDVWAGLVLPGKQFLPLARHLFSSYHPDCTSQNRVEAAVLAQALALVRQVGLAAIVLGDRGLGRKELMVALALQGQDFVMRISADILALPKGSRQPVLLDQLLATQPWLGVAVWNRGEAGPLPGRLRVVRATIAFSRSGRQADRQTATLHFVALVPKDQTVESLVVATTLPVTTLGQARSVMHLYGQRWAIETAFETLKAWGLGRFMVRSWQAIDRLLWTVAVAYAWPTRWWS